MRISVNKEDPDYVKPPRRLKITVDGMDVSDRCIMADDELGEAHVLLTKKVQGGKVRTRLDPETLKPMVHVYTGKVVITVEEAKLLCCPFCGEPVEIRNREIPYSCSASDYEWYIECSACPCRMEGSLDHRIPNDEASKEELIGAWNKRSKQ